jgi:diguanylate cyclase (GGDEF)-like protein
MTAAEAGRPIAAAAPHPRTIGWITTSALALGGSNQSLFLIGALFVGQGAISGQGSAAVPLLIVGLLLSLAAAPGWIELVLLSPNRVGGISAVCSDAFRPYSLVLSALTGSCYWWGWVPTCGLTALLSASAIQQWFLPSIPVDAIAIAIICIFVVLNLCGLRSVAAVAIPICLVSTVLAFLSALIPVWTGHVDWHQATTFHLTTPFPGWFGGLTSLMAGLYLIGFAAPAFEAATCHVGETIDPVRNVPRAVFVSAGAAALYFFVLPLVWLGAVGSGPLGGDLAVELGPTFAPLFGASAKALAIGFMTFNMLPGTLQPLAGASRTLAQLSEDGIFPRFLARRSKRDVPWVATLVTAAGAIGLLLIGDPIWLIAAANFAYLIAIGLPSVAVWLLRRDAPQLARPYRAPRGTIGLGLAAAIVWMLSAVLGFEQFGLPTVLIGLLLAYSGGALYAWRKLEDRRRDNLHGIPRSLHLTLTIMMVAVLALDGGGYLIAIQAIAKTDPGVVAALQDIFVVVALLTIGAGLALPSMIADAATRELGISNATLRHGAAALHVEISERKLAEERLLYAASHDELTGLANRAHFMERFNQLIVRMHRHTGHLAAVLFLDLDRFKRVNDSLGHLAGDQLLVAVARRIESCLRTGDVLARMGGDEFTVLLEDIESADGHNGAITVAERILADLRNPFTILGREVYASASIGIAVTQTGRDAPEDVLRDADIAMYRAKDQGKARYEIFVPELLTQAVTLLQLESDLKGALERREFVLFYQPIVSLNDGILLGFEALIRWQHPQRGFICPDDFIPSAEDSGAILPIGAWVIEEACRQAANWRDEFARREPLAISVNVSAKQFSNGADLLEQIERSLKAFALSPQLLHLEITESAIMRDPDVATVTLMELHRLGIEVHLDDFGTGYSSLGYLQRFPVDTLKIDRSFISSGASAAVRNPEIVQTITSLARSLSLKTTAEGIETAEQLAYLSSLGCTHGQGYHFSRPLNPADATWLIGDWNSAQRVGLTGHANVSDSV